MKTGNPWHFNSWKMSLFLPLLSLCVWHWSLLILPEQQRGKHSLRSEAPQLRLSLQLLPDLRPGTWAPLAPFTSHRERALFTGHSGHRAPVFTARCRTPFTPLHRDHGGEKWPVEFRRQRGSQQTGAHEPVRHMGDRRLLPELRPQVRCTDPRPFNFKVQLSSCSR